MLTLPAPTKRAIALTRVSKDGGRSDNDTLRSPEIQRAEIERHALRTGYTVVEWVEAVDESASQTRSRWWSRLQEALRAVESGEAEAIYVYALSRFTRNRLMWAKAIAAVESAGGTLISATEEIDASTPQGRLLRGMLAEFAAFEAEVKGEQWKDTQAARRAQGLPGDGRPRYGYSKHGQGKHGEYRPVDELRPVMLGLYEQYVAGASHSELTKWLGDQGLRGGNGARWTAGTLADWMDRGWAAGYMAQGGYYREGRVVPLTLTRGAHEAVVGDELWQAYLKRREAQRRVPTRARSPKHPLVTVTRCASADAAGNVCGARMVAAAGHRARGLDSGYMLRCSAHQDSQSCPGGGTWATAERVETAVVKALGTWANDRNAAQAVLDNAAVKDRRPANDSRRSRERVLALESKVHRLVSEWAGEENDLRRKTLRAVEEETRADLETAKEHLVRIGEARQTVDEAVPQLTTLAEDWPRMDRSSRIALLTSVLLAVYVIPGERREGKRYRGRATIRVVLKDGREI